MVPDVVALGRKSLRIIRQNLVIALTVTPGKIGDGWVSDPPHQYASRHATDESV